MLKLTLLDFSSGDCQFKDQDQPLRDLYGDDVERTVLAYHDETPITLRRSYAPGKHETTVGELRRIREWGWWGW